MVRHSNRTNQGASAKVETNMIRLGCEESENVSNLPTITIVDASCVLIVAVFVLKGGVSFHSVHSIVRGGGRRLSCCYFLDVLVCATE